MPRPLEFHTQNHRSVCLPCVGVVPRAANGNLYDCRWQSYRYYVAALLGSRRGCTVGSCKRLSNDSLRHIGRLHPLSHGLRHDSSPYTGEPLAGANRQPLLRFLRLSYRQLADEACLAPTMPCREIFEKPTFPIPQKPACGGDFPHRRVFLLHFIASLPFPVVF